MRRTMTDKGVAAVKPRAKRYVVRSLFNPDAGDTASRGPQPPPCLPVWAVSPACDRPTKYGEQLQQQIAIERAQHAL